MEVLPDDLVRECLVRVPYESHHNLRHVCRSWEAMLSSREFYEHRKRSGKSKQLICLIQFESWAFHYHVTIYDPAKGTWERPLNINDRIRIPFRCECVSVNRKLVFIGGTNPRNNPYSDDILLKSVYIYDFESDKWSRGADMSIARHSFAFSVSPSTGLIYVAGGRNQNGDSLRVAEVYDVEKDTWEILPPMIEERGNGGLGVFMDNKFIVLGGGQNIQLDTSAEVFDQSAGTWTIREDMCNFAPLLSMGFAIANSFWGRDLYLFFEEKIMKYDGEKNVWIDVASLPHRIQYFSSTTQWRDCILVTGCDIGYEFFPLNLFNPSTGQSIEVECREDFVGFVTSATTVEI